MRDKRFELAKMISIFSPGEGKYESPVQGTHCIKISQPNQRTKCHWRPSLGIIAQGCKEIVLGNKVYQFDDAHYIATPIDLPVMSRIAAASPEKPFLGLLVGLDPLTLGEVAAQLEKDFPQKTENPLRAIFVGKTSDKMLDATVRLGELFQNSEEACILGPLIIKEILYHLLKGPDGPAIWQFVRSGSKMHKVSESIYRLKSELDIDVDIDTLAKNVNMSRSAFFKCFKEVTTLSPIQYQKRLRLLEARRLMTEKDETAESSAFKVGYKSTSQFSREYARMFGDSPLRDTKKIRKIANLTTDVQ